MRAVTDVRVYVCVARVPAGFSTRASSQIRDAMYSSRGRSSMRPHIGQCLGVCVCVCVRACLHDSVCVLQ